jgi:nicotinate-nucleotide adenylyltransferase
LALDRVWFVPAGIPPHKPDQVITAGDHRRTMVELAIAGDEGFALSAIELERAGPSYTAETLRELRAVWGPHVEMLFVLGWDMLLYLPFWHDVPGVLAAVDRLVAVHRPGFAGDDAALADLEARIPGLRAKLVLAPAPQLEISATMLRERVARGLPIRYLVPDPVHHYIAEQGLYRTPSIAADAADKHAREDEHAPGRREEVAR